MIPVAWMSVFIAFAHLVIGAQKIFPMAENEKFLKIKEPVRELVEIQQKTGNERIGFPFLFVR